MNLVTEPTVAVVSKKAARRKVTGAPGVRRKSAVTAEATATGCALPCSLHRTDKFYRLCPRTRARLHAVIGRLCDQPAMPTATRVSPMHSPAAED